MSTVIGETILGKIQKIMVDKTEEENIGIVVIVMTEVGIGLDKCHFPEIMRIIEIVVQAVVDLGQDLEQVQTGIG